MIRLMVVDDHELVRIGLRHMLADYPAIQALVDRLAERDSIREVEAAKS